MTPGDVTFPAIPALTGWFRTLRQPQRLWAGTLRIWQTEVALAPTANLDAFLQRTPTATGVRVAELAHRYGIHETPPPPQITRASAYFLPTATGLVRVDLKGLYLPSWPTPLQLADVPPNLAAPTTTGGLAFQPHDWHTVPVVRALAFLGVAVQSAETIGVYPLKPSAGVIVANPLFQLPPTAFAPASAADWEQSWHTWCANKRIVTGTPPTISDGIATLTKHPAAHHLRTLPEIAQDTCWLFAGNAAFQETALLRLAE